MTTNDGRRPPHDDDADDAADDDARDRAGALRDEREADILVQLVGRVALDRGGEPHEARERFYEWWRGELRGGLSRGDRAELDARAAAFAARLATRLALESVSVGRLSGLPATRPAPVAGPLKRVLAAAAAERSAPALDLGVAAGTGRELWEEEATSWVSLPEGTAPGEYVVLSVAGDSMEPLLHPGDQLLVRLGGEAVRDSIIVARHPEDGYVVKRVAATRARQIELASLNPDFGPLLIPRRSDCVLGTVVLRWCDHGRRRPRSARRP